jgi:hypothetical protein
MTHLSDRQIAQYVAGGGFTGEDQVIGVAVVLAESSGNTAAKGDMDRINKTWGPSIGLFQIRSLNAERGTGKTRDEQANYDPATNARHAHRVFLDAGSRWTPWSTFKNGSHRRYLQRARAVAPVGAGGPRGETPNGVYVVRPGDTLSAIAHAHGVSLDRLRELNPGLFDAAHHQGNLIKPGEVVRL